MRVRPDEEKWGRHRVVVLSYGLWKSQFGGAAEVVGQTIILDGEPYTVAGVLPPGAWFANTRAQLFRPLAFPAGHSWNTRQSHFLFVVARLRSGVNLAAARTEMTALAQRIESENPVTNQGWGAAVTRLEETILGDISTAFRLLAVAAGFLLLIACANIANLLLVRANRRQREFAVRASVGAGKARLIRQLTTESVTLSLAGGIAGMLLAAWAVDILAGWMPEAIPETQ